MPGSLTTWFRPERLNYVRRVLGSQPAPCVFCEGAKVGVSFERLLLYCDNDVMVFLNKYPYNSGHVLVLPRVHTGELHLLPEETYLNVSRMLQRVVRYVKEEFQPKAMNIGMNLGAVAGAGIPDHLHYHVIPRWDGDTNFFPIIAKTKIISMGLKETYDRLKPYFE